MSNFGILEAIGTKVSKRREILKLSAQELAKRAEIEVDKIVSLERFEWDIDVISLTRLANVLETSPASLLTINDHFEKDDAYGIQN